MSWSGGKDCALALHEIQLNGKYEILSLLTTVTEDYDRVSMHGVRRVLLEQQAESIGLPLEKVFISKETSNEEYELKMRDVLTRFQAAGVSSVAFGDIYLEDLRKYREENLSKIGMTGIFQLWKRDSAVLSHTFINLDFKAVVTCVDTKVLDQKFVGRIIDDKFSNELPPDVDLCGENGEFHSFVFDGPVFKKRIGFTIGEVVLRDSFAFCDLLPV